MIRFYANIGCSECKVLFNWRKKKTTTTTNKNALQENVRTSWISFSLSQNSHRTTQTQSTNRKARIEPVIRDAQKFAQNVFPPWRPTLTSRSLQSIAQPFQKLSREVFGNTWILIFYLSLKAWEEISLPKSHLGWFYLVFSEGKATKGKIQFFRFIWPLTRRAILASVSSVYNPLGLVAPFLLPSKQILQDLCKNQLIGISLYPTFFGLGGKSGGVSCTHVQRHAFPEEVKALETGTTKWDTGKGKKGDEEIKPHASPSSNSGQRWHPTRWRTSLSSQPSICCKASCLVTKERVPQRPDSSPFSPTYRPPGSSKNARRNLFVRHLENWW